MGGGQLFGGLGELHAAKRLAAIATRMLGGFEDMLPQETFLKLCNLMRFGAYMYFHEIFTLKNIHFYR